MNGAKFKLGALVYDVATANFAEICHVYHRGSYTMQTTQYYSLRPLFQLDEVYLSPLGDRLYISPESHLVQVTPDMFITACEMYYVITQQRGTTELRRL